jgi:hypothetical protein
MVHTCDSRTRFDIYAAPPACHTCAVSWKCHTCNVHPSEAATYVVDIQRVDAVDAHDCPTEKVLRCNNCIVNTSDYIACGNTDCTVWIPNTCPGTIQLRETRPLNPLCMLCTEDDFKPSCRDCPKSLNWFGPRALIIQPVLRAFVIQHIYFDNENLDFDPLTTLCAKCSDSTTPHRYSRRHDGVTRYSKCNNALCLTLREEYVSRPDASTTMCTPCTRLYTCAMCNLSYASSNDHGVVELSTVLPFFTSKRKRLCRGCAEQSTCQACAKVSLTQHVCKRCLTRVCRECRGSSRTHGCLCVACGPDARCPHDVPCKQCVKKVKAARRLPNRVANIVKDVPVPIPASGKRCIQSMPISVVSRASKRQR